MSENPSLRWRLVSRLLALQAAMLVLLVLLVVGGLWMAGYLVNDTDDGIVDVLQAAVGRESTGDLVLRPTPALVQLRAEEPSLWFVITDTDGHRLTDGDVPPEFERVAHALDLINQARLGWQLGDDRPNARFKRVDTAAGEVRILTGMAGRMPFLKMAMAASLLFGTVIVPTLVVMAVATLLATRVVVRRALAGLDDAAREAERIDIGRRGTRLPIETVPAEVAPLVRAVNAALGRLDEGYARHRRFLADAAHELRTPIAILQTRLDSLPPGPEVDRLLADVARLSTLADQLLDLQRLDGRRDGFEAVDLAQVARDVAAALAPLAIAAGYEMEFDAADAPVVALGDRAALQRAVTNLVQNAIDHGGGGGTIAVRVDPAGAIEVEDEGAGIPPDQRERIFEPFHRLRPRDRGAGLGLNLVRQIVDLHGGAVAVLDRPGKGGRFRMTVPLAPAA